MSVVSAARRTVSQSDCQSGGGRPRNVAEESLRRRGWGILSRVVSVCLVLVGSVPQLVALALVKADPALPLRVAFPAAPIPEHVLPEGWAALDDAVALLLAARGPVGGAAFHQPAATPPASAASSCT